MTTNSNGRKKSQFSALTSVPDTTTFDFVYNGQNYKITKADMLTAMGATGTIVQAGDVTGTPILDVAGTVNNIRNLEDGPGILTEVSAENGVSVSVNFTQGSGGVSVIEDLTDAQLLFRTLVAGDGISIGSTNGNITVTATGGEPSTDIVFVNSVSDLPDPSGGVITLEANKTYSLQGLIDLGSNRLNVPGGVTIFSNNRLNRGLSSTTSGALITVNSGGIVILSEMLLNAPNGSFVNIDSSGFVASKVFGIASAAVSILNDTANVSFRDFSVVDTGSGVYGFQWTGTCDEFNSDIGFYSGWTGTLFDFGTAVFSRGIFLGNGMRFITSAGNTAISGAANGANLASGSDGLLFHNKFTGDGTYVDTITEKDVGWRFDANQNLQDSSVDGLLSMQSNATNTTISVAGTPVLAAGTWTVNADLASKTTGTTGGRITYDGTENIRANVMMSVTIGPVSGTTLTMAVYVAKNGTPITASKRTAVVSSGSPASITVPWLVELSQDDYIECFVANDSNTNNVLVPAAIIRVG